MDNSASTKQAFEERPDSVAEARFLTQRPELRSTAYRILGSHWAADDAVQEAWARLQRTDDAEQIDDVGWWLVVALCRTCIDYLSDGATQFAEPYGVDGADSVEDPPSAAWPTDHVVTALAAVLDELDPAERVSFVLHDFLGQPAERIAPIVGQSTEAVQQMIAAVRERVRAVDPIAERERQRTTITTFLRGAQSSDLDAMLSVLDPEVALRADTVVVARAAAFADRGAPQLRSSVQGANEVANVFIGRAPYGRLAIVDGLMGVAAVFDGGVRAACAIRMRDGRIKQMEVVGEPAILSEMTVRLPGGDVTDPSTVP